MMTDSACRHRRASPYRKPWETGTGEHIGLFCPDCKANVTRELLDTPGPWLPRAHPLLAGRELGTLPLWPATSEPVSKDQTLSLFDR